jgi:NADPH:quinone reductase
MPEVAISLPSWQCGGLVPALGYFATMRAWQVTEAGEPRDALALNDVAPLGAPPPGMLRVRVEACGIGLPDVFLCRGSYALTPTRPFTPGQELSGVVLEAGTGARARVGERVMAVSAFFLGHGGFAEEAFALDDFCFPVPAELPMAEAAAFLIPHHTAWIGLVQRGALRAGETLLVTGGAGGTGSAAIQLGRALGARVLATARGEERQAFCRSLGAEVALDPGAGLAEAVRKATGGRGADVVYDTVGGEAFEAATRCIAHEGRLLLIGFASGRWGRVDPAHVVRESYSVLGVIPSGYERAVKERAQGELLAYRARGALRVPLESLVPFERLPDALERLAGSAVLGKLVLAVRSSAGPGYAAAP